MKSSLKLLSLIIIGISLFLMNCKEETKPEPDPVDTRTKKEFLILSPWVLKASTSNVAIDIHGTGASKDRYAQMYPCEKDNTYQFNADSTIIDKVVSKCANEKDFKGTWLLSTDDKILTWKVRTPETDIFNVIELTSTKMVLKYSFIRSGTTYELTDTYNH